MRPFDFASPTRLEEAATLLQEPLGTRPLAGGTDLLTLIKADVYVPRLLMNIKTLPDMTGVRYAANSGLRIGALTTLADLEMDPLVRRHYPALAEALAGAATPQLRNMATIAGNLLQRPLRLLAQGR